MLVLLCALSQTLPQLTAARFICAPAAATIVPLGMAYVGDVVPYERRQPVLARFLAGQMLGMITGQIAGGIIGDHFGWRTVFYVLAGVFAFAGLALMSQFAGNPWVKPLRRLPEHRPGLISDYRKLAASAWARFLIVAVFFEGLIFFGAFTYVAADLHTRFGLSFSVVGLVVAGFGIGSVLYAVTVHRLVSLLRGSGLVIGGGIVVMLGYLTLAGTPFWEVAPLAAAALGFGYYMLHNTLADARDADAARSARHRRRRFFLGAVPRPKRRRCARSARSSTAPARRSCSCWRRCCGRFWRSGS